MKNGFYNSLPDIELQKGGLDLPSLKKSQDKVKGDDNPSKYDRP
jgi:hypothetical protein